MQRHLLIPLLALCAVATAAVSSAQSAGSADILRASVTVDALDKAQRMVTVRDAKGKKDSFHAPPEMQRFDELKVGDRGEAAVIPSEQLMQLKLTAPVTVSIQQ